MDGDDIVVDGKHLNRQAIEAVAALFSFDAAMKDEVNCVNLAAVLRCSVEQGWERLLITTTMAQMAVEMAMPEELRNAQ